MYRIRISPAEERPAYFADPGLASGGDPVLSPASRPGVADRPAGGPRSARGRPARRRRPRPRPGPPSPPSGSPRRSRSKGPATPLAIRDRAIVLLTFASGAAAGRDRRAERRGPRLRPARLPHYYDPQEQDRSGRGRAVRGDAAARARAVRGRGARSVAFGPRAEEGTAVLLVFAARGGSRVSRPTRAGIGVPAPISPSSERTSKIAKSTSANENGPPFRANRFRMA
jgi:hypothetical protein